MKTTICKMILVVMCVSATAVAENNSTEAVNDPRGKMKPWDIGAWETGQYRNIFLEAGYKQNDINAKLVKAYYDLFEGPNRVYFEVGDDMAYVSDLKNHDARTEGLSYGMMVAVQLDRKDVFDRLWRWTVKYMQHQEGPREAYFAWSVNPETGQQNSPGSASDGEFYFVTDLLFASNRWGNDRGIDYYVEARRILDAMWSKDGTNGIRNVINVENKMITFVPEGGGYNWTDPSYHVPAFYEVWAEYAKDDHEDFYRECAEVSRQFLHKACHPVTGLTPDYTEFSGQPLSGGRMSAFGFDSWRVPMNIALDYSWSCKDIQWQQDYINRLHNFLYARGIDTFEDQFNPDGTARQRLMGAGGYRTLRHSLGWVATTAAGSLMSTQAKGWKFVDAVWNAKLEPYEDGYFDPYYDGFLYLFSLMQLSGNYQIIKPASVNKHTQQSQNQLKNTQSETQSVELFPLKDVRLLESPFSEAVKANRQYLLAHDPDRLLAPFRREAGLEPKAQPYGNWESSGLDGHTAGHYLSAISLMITTGNDLDDEFRFRLDYMIDELEEIQKANGNGYLGGIPGSKDYWKHIGEGNVELIWKKWAPWYNLHKMFAGLRDAYIHGGNKKALDLLVNYGNWCEKLTSGLSDAQMQQMLSNEHGGMNETLADIYALTGDKKFIVLAKRFDHQAIIEPLENQEDRLTGLHANTQIPKIIGIERIAALVNDKTLHRAAAFFWKTVKQNRSLAFGGNSVSEHFNPPDDFSGVVEHREGPETCNTYNMLRLTEELFAAEPKAAYADYYERALYNHILASINIEKPGYVYFTPIRPDHYRVYSVPEQCFWCCVGTGMENPGRYGEFIYAKSKDGVYVNLFIPSEVAVYDKKMILKQETKFPDEANTHLSIQLDEPATFTLNIRHPKWVKAGEFEVKVNGEPVDVESTPSSYAAIRREWKNGDTVDVELPMHTHVERLPDGSDWVAFLYGPIVLANPDGTENMDGLFANDGRMAHVANGPMVPLDKVPALLGTEDDLLKHVVPDLSAGPLHFRIKDVVVPEPTGSKGLELIPFFRLHERRYQMYWELTTAEKIAARKEKLAAEERAREVREAATIDWIAVGEQQPEVEHNLKGEGMETGIHNGRRWRHGNWIQYTLDSRGEKEVILSVTYSGDDRGREFDISVNGEVIATQKLTGEKPNNFIEKRHPIPNEILQAAENGRLTVRFSAKQWLAGGLYDVRLLKPATPKIFPFN